MVNNAYGIMNKERVYEYTTKSMQALNHHSCICWTLHSKSKGMKLPLDRSVPKLYFFVAIKASIQRVLSTGFYILYVNHVVFMH